MTIIPLAVRVIKTKNKLDFIEVLYEFTKIPDRSDRVSDRASLGELAGNSPSCRTTVGDHRQWR